MGDRSKDSALLSFKKAARRMGYASPLKIFTVAIVFTTFLLAGLGLFLWNLHEDVGMIQARNFRLGQLGSTLHHLDGILALSVQMAAATGDKGWETRYRNNEALLGKALKECEGIL